MQMPEDQRSDLNDMLDPHRREEIAGAAVEVAGRLMQKGVEISADEDPAERPLHGCGLSAACLSGSRGIASHR